MTQVREDVHRRIVGVGAVYVEKGDENARRWYRLQKPGEFIPLTAAEAAVVNALWPLVSSNQRLLRGLLETGSEVWYAENGDGPIVRNVRAEDAENTLAQSQGATLRAPAARYSPVTPVGRMLEAVVVNVAAMNPQAFAGVNLDEAFRGVDALAER